MTYKEAGAIIRKHLMAINATPDEVQTLSAAIGNRDNMEQLAQWLEESKDTKTLGQMCHRACGIKED